VDSKRRAVNEWGAGRARLIVCELTGQWATALRRELPPPAVRVYETRSVPECWAALAQAPCSFIVSELTRAGADALLERMARLERDFPSARVAVVAERSLEAYEDLMREAGAVHFASSPREAKTLASLACRHLDQVPKPPRTFTEQIWDSLPWGAASPNRTHGNRSE